MKGNDIFPGKVITADEVPKVSGGEVRDISAEVLDLLKHIRDQVDKLCSLPPEVLESSGQAIHDHHKAAVAYSGKEFNIVDYSGSADGIKVKDESVPTIGHELQEAIKAIEEFKDKKVSEIKELFDESGPISDAKLSKSISKRVVAQKPTKVIKTVDDVKEIVAASKDRKAKK